MKIHYEVARYFEKAQGYNEALQIYENILNTTDDDAEKLKIRLNIARNYFYKGDYDQATLLAQELVNSGDSQTAFQAQTIITSIAFKVE